MRRVVLGVLFVGLLALGGCVADPAGTAETSPETSSAATATAGNSTLDTAGDSGGCPVQDETASETPEGVLEIHHIDVGQADATLFVAPSGETMVVDTGDWRADGREVIDYLDEHGVERVDHLVATHAHADHIGGHAALVDHYETERRGVGAAYDSGVAHTTQTYDRYLDTIEAHDVTLFEVRAGDELPFGEDLDVTVLNPPADESVSGLHANSVTLAVEFGEVRYLTTGDAEAVTERRLVAAGCGRLDVDVYQAGHHGSSTSSSDRFLDRTAPEIAVISSAVDSQYGHPHDETLWRFADYDIETYWTGVHGDVVVTTNGTGVNVSVEYPAPTDPMELLDRKPTTDDASQESVSRSPIARGAIYG